MSQDLTHFPKRETSLLVYEDEVCQYKPMRRHGGGPLKLTIYERYASPVLSVQCIPSQNILQDQTMIYESEVFSPNNSPFSMPLLPVILESIF